MTYYVSSGTLNPTHSLTHSGVLGKGVTVCFLLRLCKQSELGLCMNNIVEK